MKPVLQALVVAERVYEEKTGKKVICGTFNQITMGVKNRRVVEQEDGSKTTMMRGGEMGCPWVYINLTDVVSGTTVGVEMMNISKNLLLFANNFEIPEAHRLGTVELVLPLLHPKLWAKEPGTFSLDLIWNGEILGSHRLVVVHDPDEGEEND